MNKRTRTGRATDIDVASSAAMSVMTARLAKARWKRHPGLNALAELCDFSDTGLGLDGGGSGVSLSLGSMVWTASSDDSVDVEGAAIALAVVCQRK
jgi:hypothetical protein